MKRRGQVGKGGKKVDKGRREWARKGQEREEEGMKGPGRQGKEPWSEKSDQGEKEGAKKG